MMKRFSLFVLGLAGTWAFAQEKTNFTSLPNIVKQIYPNEKLDTWAIYHVEDGAVQELKKVGTIAETSMPEQGFGLHPHAGTSYYYIAYTKAGKKNYVTTNEDLKKFIGKVDNVQEAAILGMLDGYFFDSEYKDYAGNYREDAKNYYIELGKITSTQCPLQKNHFIVTVPKGSSEIEKVDDVGKYMELYMKSCKNNPRLLKLKEEHQAEVKREAERNNPQKKKR